MNKLILIIGPTAVGKTSILNELMKTNRYDRLITCTTREPREGEVNGSDYHFLKKETFEEGIKDNLFVEHANVHGNLYGINSELLQNQLSGDKDVLAIVDHQGASTLKDLLRDNCKVLFIEPNNKKDIIERLAARGDEEEDTRKRLVSYSLEIQTKNNWDYLLTNENNKFADCVKSIENYLSNQNVKA